MTVVWPKVTMDHGEEIAGPDRLRGRYGDPARSGLKVTIKEGENALPPIEVEKFALEVSTGQGTTRPGRSNLVRTEVITRNPATGAISDEKHRE